MVDIMSFFSGILIFVRLKHDVRRDNWSDTLATFE